MALFIALVIPLTYTYLGIRRLVRPYQNQLTDVEYPFRCANSEDNQTMSLVPTSIPNDGAPEDDRGSCTDHSWIHVSTRANDRPPDTESVHSISFSTHSVERIPPGQGVEFNKYMGWKHQWWDWGDYECPVCGTSPGHSPDSKCSMTSAIEV